MAAEPDDSPTEGLYPRLAGPAWRELPKALQRMHDGPGTHASGVFEVLWSANPLARLLARLGRLPRPGAAVRVELHVQADERGETWVRTFEGRPFVTRQWAEDGLLVELAPGGVELRFALESRGGVLRFHQRRAALRLGPLRLPLPGPLAPRVDAQVSGDDARVRVEVELRAPLIGRLCRYAGLLD